MPGNTASLLMRLCSRSRKRRKIRRRQKKIPSSSDDPQPQPEQPAEPKQPDDIDDDNDPELDDDEDLNEDTDTRQQWTEPKPLPDGLAPVMAFDLNFLPTGSGAVGERHCGAAAVSAGLCGSLSYNGARLIDWSSCRHQATSDDGLDRIPEPVGLLHWLTGDDEVAGNAGRSGAAASSGRLRLPATTKLRVKLTRQI